MVNSKTELLDKIHLQKYIYLLTLYVQRQIDSSMFETLFLGIRRGDNHWLSGQFSEQVSKILDTFFLDLDEYVSDDLFDPNDQFNINEIELRKRAEQTLVKLRER